MTIVIKPGDVLHVRFSEVDDEIDCDGCITVGFTEKEIYVKTEDPDSTGRSGVIYSENFGTPPSKSELETQDRPGGEE
jgi:hypothetical protein